MGNELDNLRYQRVILLDPPPNDRSLTVTLPDGTIFRPMDLELAVDMLSQAENLDVVFLASGDSDFVRLVRAVQNQGRTVEVISLGPIWLYMTYYELFGAQFGAQFQ